MLIRMKQWCQDSLLSLAPELRHRLTRFYCAGGKDFSDSMAVWQVLTVVYRCIDVYEQNAPRTSKAPGLNEQSSSRKESTEGFFNELRTDLPFVSDGVPRNEVTRYSTDFLSRILFEMSKN